MTYFKKMFQAQLLPVQRFVMMQMICVILAALSDERVRIYTTRNRGISLNRHSHLPTWYSGKNAIMKHKEGHELVYVDIPMSLLFCGDEPFYSSTRGCYLYTLKGTALRFAKRSFKTFRVA